MARRRMQEWVVSERVSVKHKGCTKVVKLTRRVRAGSGRDARKLLRAAAEAGRLDGGWHAANKRRLKAA